MAKEHFRGKRNKIGVKHEVKSKKSKKMASRAKPKPPKKRGRPRKVLRLNSPGQPFFMRRDFWKFYTVWWRRDHRGGNDVALGSVYYHWGVWVGVCKGEVRIAVVGKTKKEAAWRLYRYASRTATEK